MIRVSSVWLALAILSAPGSWCARASTPMPDALLAAIRADPDDATLHQLLGPVYERTGLDQLASHEFDEAKRLAGR